MQGSGRSERLGFGTAFLTMALLVLGLWLLEGLDQASNNALDDYGIRPRSDEGLLSIFMAPWLHGGWAHLLSNTVPFFVLGIIVLLEGCRARLSRGVHARLLSLRWGPAAGLPRTDG
jgi:hypothetical protein